MLGPYEGTDLNGPYEVRVRYKRPFADALSPMQRTNSHPSVRPQSRSSAIRALRGRRWARDPSNSFLGRKGVRSYSSAIRTAGHLLSRPTRGRARSPRSCTASSPTQPPELLRWKQGKFKFRISLLRSTLNGLQTAGVSRQPSVSPRACPMGFCLTRRGGHSLTRRSGSLHYFGRSAEAVTEPLLWTRKALPGGRSPHHRPSIGASGSSTPSAVTGPTSC